MRYVVPGLLGACLCTAVILFGAVELHHALYVYGLVALLALIWVGKLFFARTANWKPSPMHWPALGFVAYTVIHYFFSPYEYLSRMELFQVCLYGLVYFVVANNINRGQERTVVIGILLVLGTLEAMYGVWQGYTRHDYVLFASRPDGYLGRGSGTYVCPNHLAGLLEMILGFALARLALYRPSERESIERQLLSKVLIAYAVLAMLAGILFTLSRGGWASTAVGVLLFLVWGGLRTRGVLARIGVGVAALSVFGFLLFSVPKVRYYLTLNTLDSTQNQLVALKDATMSGRSLLWGATWNMIKDNPVFGTGAGTWQWVHQKYRDPQMQFTADYAHNDILQATSDYGLVGFLLIGATLACFYWHAGRLSIRGITPEHRCFSMGAVLAVSTLVVHSWFDFNLHIPANGLLFATILGMVAGMEIPDGPYGARPLRPALRYVLGAALVGVVALGATRVWSSAQAVRYTHLGDIEKDHLQWDDAIEYFYTAIDYDPKYIRARTKLADLYYTQATFRLGEDKVEERAKILRKCIKHYRVAHELNPLRSDVLLKLAGAYELAGEFESACKTFDDALAKDPNNGPLHFQYGLFLRRRGEDTRALQLFERSHKLQPNDSVYLNILDLRAVVQAN